VGVDETRGEDGFAAIDTPLWLPDAINGCARAGGDDALSADRDGAIANHAHAGHGDNKTRGEDQIAGCGVKSEGDDQEQQGVFNKMPKKAGNRLLARAARKRATATERSPNSVFQRPAKETMHRTLVEKA
jgi:hypothetical protein